jgi:hypothetical protein
MNAGDWLKTLGFSRMTETDDVVYTNTESGWMTQVWVLLEGEWDGYQMWDATDGLDCKTFFQWWEDRSSEDHYENCRYD